MTSAIARFPGPFVRTLFADAVAQEFRTLQALRNAGLPVPSPLHRTSDLLLLEYLPGVATANPTDPDRFVDEMASMLARIHSTPLDGLDFLLETKRTYSSPTRDLRIDLREDDVVSACRALLPRKPAPTVLRHGDFWPGNLLWQNQSLTGVIDWENALSGPALADLAISRLDILWILGHSAMEQFTQRYLARNPLDLTDLTYWDLRAALRPMENLSTWAASYPALERPDITFETMQRGLLDFIVDTLSRVSC